MRLLILLGDRHRYLSTHVFMSEQELRDYLESNQYFKNDDKVQDWDIINLDDN